MVFNVFRNEMILCTWCPKPSKTRLFLIRLRSENDYQNEVKQKKWIGELVSRLYDDADKESAVPYASLACALLKNDD